MSEQLTRLADDFWNIRGVFKLGGVVNIGTHCSIARRPNGKFVVLDAYALNEELKRQVDALTNNGDDIEAVINLHPFHTVNVEGMHEQYPDAAIYGTARHVERFPDLPWQPELSESAELQALFADEFEFSVPAGVDFISANENVHFSSVLAFHKSSNTLHVDDTLMCLELPGPLSKLSNKNLLGFHPTLSKALEKRAGAAADFREWAKQYAARMSGCDHLCAAHAATISDCAEQGGGLSDRILKALAKVEKTLSSHEKKYG